MDNAKPMNGKERRYRDKMREKGYYYMSLWVPKKYAEQIKKIVLDFLQKKKDEGETDI